MELTIRILNAVADYLLRLAQAVKERAIASLRAKEDKAEVRRQQAVQASHDAWDREVKRHNEQLQRCSQNACAADAQCEAEVQALEDKIKRIELS